MFLINDIDLDRQLLIKSGGLLFNKFSKKLKKVVKDPGNEKSVHDIRTAIKKIKAYLNLIHFICPDFNLKKEFKSWKALFKEVAGVRDWQIHSKVAELNLHIPIEEVIIKYPDTPKDLSSYAKIFNKGFYHERLKAIDSWLKKGDITKYVKEYRDEIILKIRELLLGDKEYRTQKLHVLRKLLKEYYYNLDLIKSTEGKLFTQESLEAWLKNMGGLLGDWHDIRSLIDEILKTGKSIKITQANESIKRDAISRLETIEQKMIHKINHLCADAEQIERLFPIT